MAGLSPYYLPITESGQPDYHAVPDAVWKDCQFCFICTPGNPTGTVIDEATLAMLIEKAHQFDFWLASDECYSKSIETPHQQGFSRCAQQPEIPNSKVSGVS